MFKKLAPNIIVNDVNKTVEYYIEKLGFELDTGINKNKVIASPGEELIWANLKRDHTNIFFQSKESIQETLPKAEATSGEGFTLYFSVRNLQEFFCEIENIGVNIVKPPYVSFYGIAEFVIKDINGCVLYFGEQSD